MTDEELLAQYNIMKEMFGDRLPNPRHYPKQFFYYFLLFQHEQQRKEKSMVTTGMTSIGIPLIK